MPMISGKKCPAANKTDQERPASSVTLPRPNAGVERNPDLIAFGRVRTCLSRSRAENLPFEIVAPQAVPALRRCHAEAALNL